MALGYCMVCETLRTIRPGEQKWGSREVNWYPIPHSMNVHTICGNPVTQDENEWPECVKCGQVRLQDTVNERCPGDKRAIK